MLKNPLLKEAQAKIDAGVQDRDAFSRIVQAGKKSILDKNAFAEMTKGLDQSKDPIREITMGIIGLLGVLYKQSRNTMPKPSMVLAGWDLLLYALDMADSSGLVKINDAGLKEAREIYCDTLFPMIGITPDLMDSTLAQINTVIKDPAKLAQIQGGQ